MDSDPDFFPSDWSSNMSEDSVPDLPDLFSDMESDISDYFSSDSEDEQDNPVIVEGRRLWQHQPGRKKKSANKHRVRMDMQERIRQLEAEGENEFQETYKLTIPKFKEMAANLDTWLDLQKSKAVSSSGSSVPAELRLSMALRFFAGGHVKDIIHMHGVHKSTFYKSVWEVVDFLNETIPLSFPLYNRVKLEEIAKGFSIKTNGAITKCVGALDGIAIKIKCPRTVDTANPMHYYNRKGFYAYVLQGVGSSDLRLLYISATCVGSTHDSVAFQHSALHRAIKACGGIPGCYFLIGDEAYAAGEWMVVPFSGQKLPVDKDTANYYISLAREVVERVFGVLVARFGILHRALPCRTKRVPKLLGALARLHNLCIDQRIPSSSRDYQAGDMPIVVQQDECADEEQGRRRDRELSAARQEIADRLAEWGWVRPPHSPWGRSNQ